MEIAITPQVQVQTQLPTQAQTAHAESSNAPLQKAVAVQPTKKVEQQNISTNPDQKNHHREAAVKKAAEMFKDVFPVSDVTFSIYKGSDGHYITRFTSLRNGKVTYIPEQDMIAYLNRAGRQYTNIEIDA